MPLIHGDYSGNDVEFLVAWIGAWMALMIACGYCESLIPCVRTSFKLP
jgi:hypothetical protein